MAEEEGDRFECREYYIDGHPHAILHSKLLISKSGDSVVFLSGSCNLTENALERNREHGVWVECGGDKELAGKVAANFTKLWDDEETGPVNRP